MSRRCSDPACHHGPGLRPARVSGRYRMCRKCRAFWAVAKGAQRARDKLASTDEKPIADVQLRACRVGGE
jgi:hypothetical protein